MGNIENEKKEKIIFSNGDKYIGETKGEKKEGYGILYYKNGDRYEGFWENNLENGTGSF